MRRTILLAVALLLAIRLMPSNLWAQTPLKMRPDALPSVPEHYDGKSLQMASTVEEMASWDRYPTYETYLAMMQQWTDNYPMLCHVDTIGYSIQGRLILSMYIEVETDDDLYRPEFFYSSTIHGDEVTGYVMLLHLIDTLLTSYGTNDRLTQLVHSTRISINPLANPDGTYRYGNHTVQGSRRENHDGVDLNRRYPDPFGPNNYSIPQENQAMIDYVSAHHFKLSANLHGGSEVMNYPWDCFTSANNPHPYSSWWREVSQRFVDSARAVNNNLFRDVNSSGVIAGGDWYVIHGGRQDYMNYYHDCLEITMEVSSIKTLPSEQLPNYWKALATPLINYIGEIHSLPNGDGINNPSVQEHTLMVYPNPVSGSVTVGCLQEGMTVELFDMQGHRIGGWQACGDSMRVSTMSLENGIYLLRAGTRTTKIIKK